MERLKGLKPERVFHYFEKICSIPHGSGNQDAISEFCVNFAAEHSLKCVRDNANNVVIYKDGTGAGKGASPIILQGHLDMVCQKVPGSDFDFEKSGLDIYTDGDFVKAKDTTLGADNGIAVAMILAILEDAELVHPPVEAVFTTDEEIGMIGAKALDFSLLKGSRMINLDTEHPDNVIVSCAGGSDFEMIMPVAREQKKGTRVRITLSGLTGGHSGAEINKGRVNADILVGRVLNEADKVCEFSLISVCGGDKGNAIPRRCEAEVVVDDAKAFVDGLTAALNVIKKEISDRDKDFSYSLEIMEQGTFDVVTDSCRRNVVHTLLTVPNGIMDMSATMANLVETSLNLGILETAQEHIRMLFALRSNKTTALRFLEERLRAMAVFAGCSICISGQYPPWEFRDNSCMQRLYKEIYSDMFGEPPNVTAIHAGLECGVFDSNIENFDCISIGPEMSGIHTTEEKLSISSTEKVYNLIKELLKKSI